MRAARAHPGQVGMGPVGDAQPHVVRVRSPKPAARPRTPAPPCASLPRPARGTDTRARATPPAFDRTMRACGWSSVPARRRSGAHVDAPARASTSASTSACTSSGPRVASTRRQLRVRLHQVLVGRHHRLLQPDPSSKRSLSPTRAASDGQVEQHGQIGSQAARRKAVDPLDVVDPEPARPALVGERGVEEPIRTRRRGREPTRAGSPPSPARARRREQQRLALRRQPHRGSFRMARTRSPAVVPPGSRTPSASSPSASHSSRAWVVLPDRSMPSKVTNSPRIRGANVAPSTVARVRRRMNS